MLPALLGGLLLAISAVTRAEAPLAYDMVDIGTLGGAASGGTSINPAGEITGTAEVPGSGSGPERHAFRFSGGSMTDLGVPADWEMSSGVSIGSGGDVLIQATAGWGTRFHTYLLRDGALIDLGSLGGETQFTFGRGINSLGQVTGSAETSDRLFHAFIYDNGTMTDLGAGGNVGSSGASINTSGQVTGGLDLVSAGSCCVSHAFFYSAGAMLDLGTLGGRNSQGLSINSAGLITGYSDTAAGTYHAFLYSGSGLIDLGALDESDSYSYGSSINSAGIIVGWSSVRTSANDVTQHAFVYSEGTMTDLNTLVMSSPLAAYVTLERAAAINDRNWIVVNGTDSRTGNTHAYLLKPPGGPRAKLETKALSFGQQKVDTASPLMRVKLANTGTADLHVGTPSISGDDPDDFMIQRNGCKRAITPGKTCAIDIIFHPAARGGESARLSIPSDGADRSQVVKLKGNGIR